jgi:hypothetical protein
MNDRTPMSVEAIETHTHTHLFLLDTTGKKIMLHFSTISQLLLKLMCVLYNPLKNEIIFHHTKCVQQTYIFGHCNRINRL